MGIVATRKAVEELITNRGQRAKKLWSLLAPMVRSYPDQAISTLRDLMPVFTVEMQSEAKSLIRDIKKILMTPPLP